MYTKLVVDKGDAQAEFSVIDLLDILQQSLPGGTQASGFGTPEEPWSMASPAQWFWMSKNLTHPQAWCGIGGRLVRVGADDLYASDHGSLAARAKEASSTRDALSTKDATSKAASDRFSDDRGPSYPEIYFKLSKDHDLSQLVVNSAVASQVRALLNGAQKMTIAPSDALPVMVGAMFLSEVKRNHTAFHTGLMVLDLVEAGVRYMDNKSFTWEKVLWHPDILKMEMELASKRPDFREDRSMNEAFQRFKDEATEKNAFDKTVSREVRGGDHPMTASDTVRFSKQSLVGASDMTLTMVRQKEANIVIHWLCEVLKAKYKVIPSAEPLKKQTVKEEQLMSSAVGAAASATGADLSELGSAAKKKLDSQKQFLANPKTELAMVIGAHFQQRCNSFDAAF